MNKLEIIKILKDQSGPPKLLVVDDQPVNIFALCSVFENDFDVLVATDGPKALALASNEKPDVILLDINMPHMNGYEVLAVLREQDETRNIPVIFITGETEASTEEYGLNLGAVDFISKPFNDAIVRARVLNHTLSKLQFDKLKDLAEIDSLTGLYNRRRFDYSLSTLWSLSLRESCPLSILLLDVDYFKPYNDHYGHIMGDMCLREIGKMLSESNRRKSDIFCRYGGEEFACLLYNTDVDGAVNRAEYILDAVRRLAIEHKMSTAEDIVTVSIGVHCTIPQSQGEMEFVSAADKALYRSKERGRNCYTLSESALKLQAQKSG